MTGPSASDAADRPEAGLISRETAWLLPVVLPVTFAGAAVTTAALVLLASDPPGLTTVGGLLALFAAAAFVEAFPIPIEADRARESETSLANVFIVGTAVIYGWEAATVFAFATMLLIESLRRQQRPARAGFNSALYALAAAAAGGAAALASGDSLLSLLAAAALGSVAFYMVNIGLLAVVIARVGREPYTAVLRRYFVWTALPFLIMASVTLMLAVLWDRSPFLAAALAGPLIAIALYERSVHRAVEAMRLAATDPLTGLGNYGCFHTRLDALLEEARATGTPLVLILLDIDDFKQINDTFGHPMGDRVLAQVAGELRRGDQSFRLGGDEFAIILPGAEEAAGLAAAGALVQRLGETTFEHGDVLTMSAVSPSSHGTPPPAESWSPRPIARSTTRRRPRRVRPGPTRRPRSRSGSSAAWPRCRTATPACGPRRASPSQSTPGTPTRGATRTRWASSRPGLPRHWGFRPTRSGSCGSPVVSTISASSRSPRRSCASPGRSTTRSGSSSSDTPTSAT